MSVALMTHASVRSVPVWSRAGCQYSLSLIQSIMWALPNGRVQLVENWTPRLCKCQRNFREAPALSVRTRTFCPAKDPLMLKKLSGSWAAAVWKTRMWSSALFAPALPGRSTQARISPEPLPAP
jgi:hypothetical protein